MTFLIIAPYKYSYLLTYLLTYDYNTEPIHTHTIQNNSLRVRGRDKVRVRTSNFSE